MAFNSGAGWSALGGGLMGAADALSGYVKNKRAEEDDAERRRQFNEELALKIKQQGTQQALADATIEQVKQQVADAKRQSTERMLRYIPKGTDLDPATAATARELGYGPLLKETDPGLVKSQVVGDPFGLSTIGEAPASKSFLPKQQWRGLMTPDELTQERNLERQIAADQVAKDLGFANVDINRGQLGIMEKRLPFEEMQAKAAVTNAGANAKQAETGAFNSNINAWTAGTNYALPKTTPPSWAAGVGLDPKTFVEGGQYARGLRSGSGRQVDQFQRVVVEAYKAEAAMDKTDLNLLDPTARAAANTARWERMLDRLRKGGAPKEVLNAATDTSLAQVAEQELAQGR